MIVIVFFLPPLQARMYRWVDENGQAHYSDNVPTEYAKRERKVFDNNGRLISVITGPKTQDQLEAQQQQAIAEEAMRREKKEQLETDRVLMRTFTNAQELGKFHTERMVIIESTLTSLGDKLKRLRQEKANLESKDGKKIRESDLKKIERTNAEIDVVQGQLDIQIEKKKRTEKRFMAEAKRYKELKGEQ
jgi:phosphotransferase system IIB component